MEALPLALHTSRNCRGALRLKVVLFQLSPRGTIEARSDDEVYLCCALALCSPPYLAVLPQIVCSRFNSGSKTVFHTMLVKLLIIVYYPRLINKLNRMGGLLHPYCIFNIIDLLMNMTFIIENITFHNTLY